MPPLSLVVTLTPLPPVSPCALPTHRLKDIIYGFGTNNVYVVLECMDCDLRHLLDAERLLEMRQIKVSTVHAQDGHHQMV